MELFSYFFETFFKTCNTMLRQWVVKGGPFSKLVMHCWGNGWQKWWFSMLFTRIVLVCWEKGCASDAICILFAKAKTAALHSWRRCMWRSWSESWRFLAEPWRSMAEYCLRKCNGVRKKQYQEIMKIHQQIGPKTQKSIKIGKNEPRAEKVAPRIGNGAKKGQAWTRFRPPQSA